MDNTRKAVTDTETALTVQLSAGHLAAVNRRRRIYVNNDVGYGPPMGLEESDITPEQWVADRFSLFDEPGSQVDCVSWCPDEGNYACYPSNILPRLIYPVLQKWLENGVDIARLMAEECHKRGLEAFWEYRLNGADRQEDVDTPALLPMKEQHPDWLVNNGWWKPGLWSFAVPEVQEYKLAILREVAENYDYDGISLDFGRHPPALPVGEQWEYREAMTDFIRKVRLMLQIVAEKRDRPFLLAVRVPETLAGCHYDGLDVETWVRGNLIDIIVMGVRSTEVDVPGFKQITAGTHIKIYPSIDDHHSTDGYYHPPVEFFRGLAANWWQQGVDGILTFNFSNEGQFVPHQQAYHEIGSPETLRFKNKMYVLQRRYGGGWDNSFGWHTESDSARCIWDFYHNMNHEAPLPLALPNNGYPVFESIYVADDIAGDSERVEKIELHFLFSGVSDTDIVDVKFNGILLPKPEILTDGWRVFSLQSHYFANGSNLIGLRLFERLNAKQEVVTIEKTEIRTWYL